ncbi:glycosyltransferase family 4 protein [Rheinheimera sp. UJ63]|uniref:glycosyltransferase family 4 protein n=1 Tax=Rheinheimera sp. UJ63 TaxID=2910157 RepID=UPI001F3A84F0|nr:glycosyltransferase family 4 protein [Rheinheimera sp. UJ63]MCF4009361.1 glycosyltransferase family 4 protein [Rheinheimera sp. UJ63]
MLVATKKLLVITNMGPKASAPFQGQFVRAQVDELEAQGHPSAYHYMRWHSDSWLNRLLKYPVFFLDFLWRYMLSRQRYDLIHVHFFYPTIWLALLYRGLRNRQVKIVVTCHGSDIYHYQPPGKLYRWCAKQVQAWVFTSQALSEQFYFQAKPQRILSAGIQSRYAAARFQTRTEKDIDLLYVGALDRNKGMDRLLAMLPALRELHIVIAGTGPWQRQLEHAVADYPNVRLLGAQDAAALVKLYQRARCFISLSRNESFGLVMAEAMACYTPVVATDTDGAKAQITSGVTGYRVSQQQAEAQLCQQLVLAIKALLMLDEPEYRAMQQAGRQQAEQVLLPEVIHQLTQLYQEL